MTINANAFHLGEFDFFSYWSLKRKGCALDEKGQSLVEFAMVLPLLLMIAFGVTELGRAYYQYNTLTKAIRDGARYLSSNAYNAGNITNAQNIAVYGNTGGSGTAVLPGLTAGSITITGEAASPSTGGTPPWDSANPPDWIVVSVSGYTFNSLVSGIINLNVNLSPEIRMRYVGPNARF